MSVPVACQRRPVARPHRCAMPCHPPIRVAGGAGMARAGGDPPSSVELVEGDYYTHLCFTHAAVAGSLRPRQ